jgi:hypothetical protein
VPPDVGVFHDLVTGACIEIEDNILENTLVDRSDSSRFLFLACSENCKGFSISLIPHDGTGVLEAGCMG